jgi:hypothetical protein
VKSLFVKSVFVKSVFVKSVARRVQQNIDKPRILQADAFFSAGCSGSAQRCSYLQVDTATIIEHTAAGFVASPSFPLFAWNLLFLFSVFLPRIRPALN